MKRARVVLAGMTLLTASVARGQDYIDDSEFAPPPVAEPTVGPPAAAPSAPPKRPPLPPPEMDDWQQDYGGPVPGEAGVATGQWVFTGQYGWLFMPYGEQYVYEGTEYDVIPYAFVFYPSYGWTWLAAPWLWGWGAYPYFGELGPDRFVWYQGLYRAGYGWGGYRGGGKRGNVRSLGFNDYPGGTGNMTPADGAFVSSGNEMGPSYGGDFSGGYGGGYSGGYWGNRPVGVGYWPNRPGSGGGRHGGSPSSSSSSASSGSSSGRSYGGGSAHGEVGPPVGGRASSASQSAAPSAHFGGYGSGMRGGSSSSHGGSSSSHGGSSSSHGSSGGRHR